MSVLPVIRVLRKTIPAALSLSVVAAVAPVAHAQIVCNSSTGPDVIVSDLVVIKKWGTVGNITGYSIGSNACNIGDTPLEWQDDTNRHPVIAMNAYRLRNGKFEQIGMSWLKHGFYALANSDCCECQDPGSPNFLGIGCSDAYDANLNGIQQGFNNVAGLGPRFEVNAYTGEFAFPYTTQGQAGDAIYKRLQIKNADLNPVNNEGALYFAELQYITPDDAAAGNALNNASYMPIQVGAIQDGGYPLSYAGVPRPMKPAIYAWQEFDTGVTITPIDVPGDGRFFLGSKVTDIGNGLWHYEYAVFNLNAHRSAGSFQIAIPDGVRVESINFNDVPYHSGEPFDGTDWPGILSGGLLTWSTQTFAENENANALRFSTLYNFRFNANAPPGTTTGSIGLFRPGATSAVNFSVAGPIPGGGGPINDNCGEAIDVTLGSTLFTNAAANSNTPAFACAPSGGAGRDVWFRFQPTFTGRVRFSTCASVDFNNIMEIREGCSCGGTIGPVLACSDDACGTAARVNLTVQAGTCYLIRIGGTGSAAGVGTLKIDALDASNAIKAAAVLTGDAAGDRFGQSVGFAGDFKNDGVDDVIVGANLSDLIANNAGRARVGMGAGFDQGTSVSFGGEFAGDNFGRVVAGGSDFNGDGYDEILVAAPNSDHNGPDAGKVYCFSGFDDTLLWIVRGQSPGDKLGSAIAAVGDMNDDGVDDVLIGAPLNDIGGTNAGRAYLVAGQDGSVLHIFTGKAGEQFGGAVSALGDVNDDGVKDFVIAAPRSNLGGSNSGRVVVFNGATRLPLQKILGNADERLGSSLAGITLLVGSQTRTYMAMGAPGNSSNGAGSGQVRLLMRNHASPKCSETLCPVQTINGQAAGDAFGTNVDLGDVQAGGVPELLVGAPGSDANGSNSGAAYVINTANGTTIRRITGEAAGDAFGTSVSIAGDVNSDGKKDFIVGSPTNDAGGTDAGRAYVFFSQGAPLLRVADDDEHFVIWRPEDVDGNGAVDAGDVLLVIHHWGACRAGLCTGDVNGDNNVDALDLSLILSSH